ncbi:MAG: pitrilysin family protein [Bacteroidetes bacterium]|nr:pitrilysin family protein [Bacteroidota bacterium]MDA0875050.1 pitrilysin family protein [Bacteroidota bacterium]
MTLTNSPATAFPGFSPITSLGGIDEYRLDANGLTVLLCPQGEARVATVMITYRVGSRNERQGETGATHFLEHMMFKGTERYSKKSGRTIFNVLQARGARVNATTWNDRTNYYEMLPSEHLDLALEIEADRMRGLSLDPDEVASEKSVILNEFDRGENEPIRKLYHALWSTAFEAHTYHHPTIGWRQDIENVTPEGLRSFYDRFYWPGNATVSIIGGFDAAETMASIRTHFGSIPPGEIASDLAIREPEQRGERRTTIRMEGGNPAVLLGYKSPSALDPAVYPLHLAGMVLSHGRSSRLYTALVDEGLATSVSAGASSFRDPGLFTVMALLTPEVDPMAVEDILHRELRRLMDEPPTEDERHRAMATLRAETLYARDGSFSMASQLNEAIAAGDWKLLPTFLEAVERVTCADISEAARACFVRDRLTTAVYEPLTAEAAA